MLFPKGDFDNFWNIFVYFELEYEDIGGTGLIVLISITLIISSECGEIVTHAPVYLEYITKIVMAMA